MKPKKKKGYKVLDRLKEINKVLDETANVFTEEDWVNEIKRRQSPKRRKIVKAIYKMKFRKVYGG